MIQSEDHATLMYFEAMHCGMHDLTSIGLAKVSSNFTGLAA